MKCVSFSELQADLASQIEAVCDRGEPLLVIHQNDRNVVLVSEEEYEGLLETIHLLKSPANAARLMRSIEEANLRKPLV